MIDFMHALRERLSVNICHLFTFFQDAHAQQPPTPPSSLLHLSAASGTSLNLIQFNLK